MMLEFNIRNQEISRIDNFSPAEKSVEYLIAKFNFKTEDWNGATKRAIFRNVKSKVEKDTMLEVDSCVVPWEVLVGSSDIEISVHGVNGTEEITTNVAVFNLNRTLQGGSATQEPSPTVYEQMLKEMQEAKDIAQSVRDDADAGKFNGGGSIDQEALLQLAIKTTTSPSPFHHITDSANMKVLDFGMEGKTEQFTTSGKNLYSGGDVSGVGNSGYININTIPAGTYSISAIVTSDDTDHTECLASFSNDEGYATGKRLKRGERASNVITFSSDVNTVIFYASDNSGHSTDDTFSFTDIQIEAGSTTTTYEPYTNGPSPNPDYPQEIENAGKYNEATGRYEHECCVGNKNIGNIKYLFPVPIVNLELNNGVMVVDGIKMTFDSENCSFRFTGKSTKDGTTNFGATPTDKNLGKKYCKLKIFKGYTYILSLNISQAIKFFSGRVEYDDGTGSWLNQENVASGIVKMFSFTAKQNGTIWCYFPVTTVAGTAYDFTVSDIQLEISSTQTDYTPHASQQFTLTSPVPLTKWDKLVKRDGVHGWSIWDGEEEFDGSDDENWRVLNRNSSGVYFVANLSVVGVMGLTACIGTTVSDCFIEKNPVSIVGNCAWVKGNTVRIGLADDTITTVDDFKAYIAEHPFKVLYKTNEEQAFHPLPDEEQELLKNLETYYGVTNLYNDQGCPMWLEYVNDTKLYVDQKLLEIQQAMI